MGKTLATLRSTSSTSCCTVRRYCVALFVRTWVVLSRMVAILVSRCLVRQYSQSSLCAHNIVVSRVSTYVLLRLSTSSWKTSRRQYNNTDAGAPHSKSHKRTRWSGPQTKTPPLHQCRRQHGGWPYPGVFSWTQGGSRKPRTTPSAAFCLSGVMLFHPGGPRNVRTEAPCRESLSVCGETTVKATEQVARFLFLLLRAASSVPLPYAAMACRLLGPLAGLRLRAGVLL